ncbi:MAG: DUF4838 domain-containing protein [Planctomycetota bacterium]|jgi:hypothetical protein
MRLILAFLTLASTCNAGTVVVPRNASPALLETADQFAKALEAGTGEAFEVSELAVDGAVRFVRADFENPETYHVSNLQIRGASDQALRHGAYAYLHELGFRWLLPSPAWEIVPQLDGIEIAIDETRTPAFRLRNFFGTGGFGGILPVDPERKLQKRWDLWKQQNGFGGDIAVAGHSGEAFNHSHREILERHSEYFAEIDGKRQPWGVTTKLCTANPELRKLYIADRQTKLRRDIETLPGDDPRARTVSVEPADGGGHCECKRCRAIGSVSDRVYFMANEVAKSMRVEFSGRYASLFAYNQHAAPPQFDLEPNVFVLVAPYAFQRTGLPGDELVKAWGRRTPNLGVYDYWAIPDWANCLPVISNVDATTEKIRFWNHQKVSAFLGESSSSAANVGPTWYVTSRLLWNPDTDAAALADEWFDLAFGPAKEPMRRMHRRWARGFVLSEHELGLTFRDLAEARQLTAANPAVSQRIDDFILYAEYIRLWRDYRNHDQPDELIRHIWRTYERAIICSFRMFQLVARKHPELYETWPLKNADAASWQDLPEFSEAEISEILKRGVASHTPLQFTQHEFNDELVPVHKPEKLSETYVKTPFFAGTHEFEFWAEQPVTLRLRVNKRENYPGNFVRVVDAQGRMILSELAPSDGETHDLVIPVEGPGNHRMTIHDQKIFFRLEIPENLPFVARGWNASPALPAKVYARVPDRIERLAIAQQSVVPLSVFDLNGNLIQESDKAVFTVDIPKNTSRVLTLSNFKTYTPLRLLNAPEIFAFSPDGLMAPKE